MFGLLILAIYGMQYNKENNYMFDLLILADPDLSPVLREVNLTTVTNDDCAQVFGSIIDETKICTSGVDGKATCNVS